MDAIKHIVAIIQRYEPTVQAIYLFGSYGTTDEWPASDVDIALLLPAAEASQRAQLALSPCQAVLEEALGKPVDLINLRAVSTVFQKEIVATGRPLFGAGSDAVAEFEMYTLSAYQ